MASAPALTAACAGIAGPPIGLLFVAIPLRPEGVTGRGSLGAGRGEREDGAGERR